MTIPIDVNGDGVFDNRRGPDGNAVLDVASCGSATVSTKSPDCKVVFKGETFDNWDAFAAEHPDFQVIGVPDIFVFEPGTYVLTHIDVK